MKNGAYVPNSTFDKTTDSVVTPGAIFASARYSATSFHWFCLKHTRRYSMSSFYDYSVTKRDGSGLSMNEFRGKVVLVVNTATGCGFTPQYKDLEDIYEEFHDQGLEILDVPCNQFAGQTPGTDEEVHTFCTLKYNTKFDQMKKSDVNGENALDLYKFLKSQKTFEGFGKGPKAMLMNTMLKKIDPDYKNNSEIKWNFTKFLVDRKGNVVRRFEPTEDMKNVREAVKELL